MGEVNKRKIKKNKRDVRLKKVISN